MSADDQGGIDGVWDWIGSTKHTDHVFALEVILVNKRASGALRWCQLAK